MLREKIIAKGTYSRYFIDEKTQGLRRFFDIDTIDAKIQSQTLGSYERENIAASLLKATVEAGYVAGVYTDDLAVECPMHFEHNYDSMVNQGYIREDHFRDQPVALPTEKLFVNQGVKRRII